MGPVPSAPVAPATDNSRAWLGVMGLRGGNDHGVGDSFPAEVPHVPGLGGRTSSGSGSGSGSAANRGACIAAAGGRCPACTDGRAALFGLPWPPRALKEGPTGTGLGELTELRHEDI